MLIDPRVWREEVERLDARSAARIAAEREHRTLEDREYRRLKRSRLLDLGAAELSDRIDWT